jgi:tetratricopeptide (TPR) repeat protein
VPTLSFLRRAVACAGLFAAGAAAQQAPPAAPLGDLTSASALREGRSLLDAEDPCGAWQAYRRALAHGGDSTAVGVGLAAVHLMLGQSAFALAWAESALDQDRRSQEAMALAVRARIRARRFDEAVDTAAAFVAAAGSPSSELLAAQASALFRVQRTDDAAAAYAAVVAADPLHAEAHLRLGSGLLAPGEASSPPQLVAAVAALARGDRPQAIAVLRDALAAAPRHPVAHRLLGETLYAQKAAGSMAATDPAFAALAAAAPPSDVRGLPLAEFVPGYERLSPARRRIVDRTAAMFARCLPKMVAVGGRHDLLVELERTTDAAPRANLRGKRTFDGRVWDDVRGVGGMQAATGIEALDEAASFGFDTFAHEVAHQAHFYAFTPLQRARIRALYQRALAEGRCLDFYAATNEAEYFGQGVEAFASLGKRPGSETTHGHTRFELRRIDRELHDFVAEVVAFDPLATPGVREALLAAACDVALRVGRPQDAVVAAGMMAPGAQQDRWTALAARAEAAARCH